MQKHHLITLTGLFIFILTGCPDRQDDTGSAVVVQSVTAAAPTEVPRTNNISERNIQRGQGSLRRLQS